jgi:transmembrane sensor
MTLKRGNGFNHQISEEAADWLVEFRTGDIDAGGREDFDAWVRASPEHLRAFVEMAALWVESGSVDAQRRLDVDSIITRARAEGSVVGLNSNPAHCQGTASVPRGNPCTPPSAAAPTGGESRGHRRRTMMIKRALAASLLIVLLGSGALLASFLFGRPTYATDVGEQRSIELSDGSVVVLDSRSRLEIGFTATARQVRLLQGQALFHVTRNAQRPFIVSAGGTVIRDIGTQFDVDRGSDGTTVTVMEGQVAVSTRAQGFQSAMPEVDRMTEKAGKEVNDDRRDAHRPILLTAGDQIDVLARGRSPHLRRVNVSSVTAWTHGQVVLESATLEQVAAAFSRYSRRRLVAEDYGSPLLRLSGLFETNPDFLIRYLRERPDIVVRETDSKIDIVRNSR